MIPIIARPELVQKKHLKSFAIFVSYFFNLAEIFYISNLNYAHIMAVRVVEFSDDGYKINKMFSWESTYSKEIIEFWELG